MVELRAWTGDGDTEIFAGETYDMCWGLMAAHERLAGRELFVRVQDEEGNIYRRSSVVRNA